ncbi:MAG TPA: hypothetical protein VFY71_12025 [Planctomycetota bacterium]|nr:hypothetical protein [Planctomycetota bacterium]
MDDGDSTEDELLALLEALVVSGDVIFRIGPDGEPQYRLRNPLEDVNLS